MTASTNDQDTYLHQRLKFGLKSNGVVKKKWGLTQKRKPSILPWKTVHNQPYKSWL